MGPCECSGHSYQVALSSNAPDKLPVCAMSSSMEPDSCSKTSCQCCNAFTPSYSLVDLSGDSDTEPCTSDESTIASDSSNEESIDLSDDDDDGIDATKRRYTSVSVPPIDDVIPTRVHPQPVPEVIQALHRFREDIQIRDISVTDYYRELRIEEIKLNKDLPPQAHVAG